MYSTPNKPDSGEQPTVETAVAGIFDWIVYSTNGQIPLLPNHLINSLVGRAIVRQQPGLKLTLQGLAWLVENLPQSLNLEHYEQLLMSLRFLLKDTELPNKYELDRDDRSRTIPIDDIPEIRAASARLAAKLYSHYRKVNEEVPEILEEWKTAAATAILPEVKKSFAITEA
nr:hypothetical protein [Deinococcota bacterium]